MPQPRKAPPEFPVAVVIDTREQRGYRFDRIKADADEGGDRLAVRTLRGTLATGDYSLEGHTDAVTVERKSLADLFGTLGKGRDRFERELLRLSVMACPNVVVEAEWRDVFTNPPPHSMLSPKTVARSVIAWRCRYPAIHWWFLPGRAVAEAWTFRLLERFHTEVTAS